MEFKLRLVPDRPTDGELLVQPETPLSGVEFIKEVGKDLRRSIDHVAKSNHTTLGAVAIYEMNVPQAMAIASGRFETNSTFTVVAENNLLSHFIFYKANVNYHSARRKCYPYMENEATLVSMIDELAFLDAWAGTGYARRVAMSGDQMINGEYINDSNQNNDYDSNGGIGCEGCPVCADPRYCDNEACGHYQDRQHWIHHMHHDHDRPSHHRPPYDNFQKPPRPPMPPQQHHHRPHGFEPPPPPPPPIGNNSKPFTI